VLVVDDNTTARGILCELLRSCGAEPAPAADGLAALGALKDAAAAGKPYRIAVIDSRMPRMSGLALAAQIRDDARLPGTGMVLLQERDESIAPAEPGVQATVFKPVKHSDLLHALAVVSGSVQDGGAEIGPAALLRPERPLRILVAEDNPVNQRLVLRLLEKRGHAVKLARNGKEAVALAGRESFDLILMDVQMPEMDGIEAVTMVRREEVARGGRVPIIALTAYAMKGDREKCLNAGMDGYLAKPIQSQELFREIERLCDPAFQPEPRG
jgi:CheY-like chemotaxis protein